MLFYGVWICNGGRWTIQVDKSKCVLSYNNCMVFVRWEAECKVVCVDDVGEVVKGYKYNKNLGSGNWYCCE